MTGGSPFPIGPRAGMARRTFTVYRTHHGPDRARGGRQVDQRPAHGEAGRGAEPVVPADQGAQARRVSEGDGAARQLVEQHGLRRRRRAHRLLPPAVHPQAGRPVRLDPAGGRQRSRDRMARRARGRGQPARGRSAERMDPEHQRLAVLGGRGRTAPGGKASPGTWTTSARARAGCTRSGCWRDGRTSRSSGSGTRRSTAISRRSRGWCRRCWRRTTRRPRGDSLKASLAEPIAALRGVGLPLVGGLGADVARGVLGRGAHGRSRSAARERRRHGGLRLHGDAHDGGAAARRARRGGRPAHARLRHLADAVGRDQPVPAAHRGHRAAVQTTRGRASRCRSPRRAGARSRRSGRGHTRARSGGTGPAGTASSRWWSSGRTASGRER